MSEEVRISTPREENFGLYEMDGQFYATLGVIDPQPLPPFVNYLSLGLAMLPAEARGLYFRQLA